MRLEQLSYLLEVAKWHSMTQAAKQLYINPSTLSTAIKNLEDELGFSVFARTTQGVSLTVLGQQVIQYAEITCREFERLKQLPLAKDKISGQVDLSASPALYHFLTVRVITAFKKCYPQIWLHFHEKYPSQVLGDMKSGEAQIGLYNCQAHRREQLLALAKKYHYQVIELSHDKLRGYVGAANPLAAKGAVTLAEIKQYPLVTYHEYLIHNTIPEYREFDNAYIVNDQESLKKFVAENNAISIFPQLMEQDDPYIASRAIVPIDIIDLSDNHLCYYLLCAEAIARSPVEQELLDIIIRQFSQAPQKPTLSR